MTTKSPIKKSIKLKRKLVNLLVEPTSNHLINGSDLSSPDSSSSSSTSSSSSNLSNIDNQFDFDCPRKIFITEQKMADALKELQIETFKNDNNNLFFNIEMNDNNNNNDNEQEKEEFLLTNELKKTIELLNNKESNFNKFITSYDQLQLIPYNPFKSNNINKIESSHYEVEEPLDTSNNKKNLLKR